jgi:hypothetical protein
VKGAVASLLGKETPDTNVWILKGEAPTFVQAEGPLALGGPVWRIELVCPAFQADRLPHQSSQLHRVAGDLFSGQKLD